LSEYKVRLEELLPLMQECLDSGRSFTFSPHGVSMLPMLRQGRDTVTLSPLPEKLRKYDIPLYRRPDGKFVLHRIVKVGKTFTCIGDHQFWYEKGVERDWMIAVVTEFTRDGKKHPVSEWTYRLYCRLWHYTRFPRSVWNRVSARLKRLTGARKRTPS